MPFRATTYDMTQDIMLRKDTLGHKLFGKTGWGAPGNNNVGWYVGWLHRDNKAPVYFATCIEQPEPAHPRFEHWRKEITEWALSEINALTYSPDSISH
jgi:beta-lactamase class D